MLACWCHPSIICPLLLLLRARQECVSLSAPVGPIRRLKSHLHLLHSLCCPSLPLSFRPSNRLIFQPRSSTPPAAAARVIDTFIVLLFLTPCASAPDQITPATCTGLEGSRDLSHGGLSSTPSPLPFRGSHPLVPVTEEWPGPSQTQSVCCEKVCFKQGQRESTQPTCVPERVTSSDSSRVSPF